MKKRILSMALAVFMTISLVTGCSKSGTTQSASSATASEAPAKKALNMGVAFWYQMDAHKDYNGWYTSMYGITETLFKVGDDYSIQPWIAESGKSEGNTWTIKLKNNVVFSNGKPVTADVVVKNLQRAGKENARATVFNDATYNVVDNTTFTITTKDVYPTMLNDLTDPFVSILDIDDIGNDYNNKLIATGPFKIVSYEAEKKVVLEKNDKYWNGNVNLNNVTVYYIPDPATEAMSMQNGEIDMYVGPDVDSMKKFQSDKKYVVTSIPQSRLYYYIFNLSTLQDKNVRQAILLSVNKNNICTMLSGSATATVGAFGKDTAYGKVAGPEYNPTDAAKLLEAGGYKKNASGIYEKDGKPLTIRIAYYAARSIDKITTLIQDDLKKVGIQTQLQKYEDPDATYMKNGNFDLGMYFYTTTATGDPYAFLNATLSSKGNKNAGGYTNSIIDSNLTELSKETDASRRAKLETEIQQQAINDSALGYLAIPNKITVMKSGVSGCAEKNPLSIYVISAETNIK